jgi:hypothetical protein
MQVPQGFERFPHQNFFEDIFMYAAVVGLLSWGIYLFNAALKRRQQVQLQQKLLEKFSSAHDFAEFMQSPAGQKYVMSFSDAVTSPRNTIISTLRTGIVLAFLGGGLDTANYGVGALTRDWLSVAGNVLVMVGIGFMLAATISYFLAKKIRNGEKES